MVSRVVIATDSEQVAAAIGSFGFETILTGEHPNGTSRLAEAADRLGIAEDEIVINVQGDEPEIDPLAIDAAATSLLRTGADVGTVASRFSADEDPRDPNIVKAVVGRQGLAIYFSRAMIPFDRDGAGVKGTAPASPLKHVGLYAYTAGFLRKYASLPETPLEATERLEQLRVLEHGYRIGVAIHDCRHHGIDTPEQYAAFVSRWRSQGDAKPN